MNCSMLFFSTIGNQGVKVFLCHSSSTELSSVFSEERFPTFFDWIGQMKQTDAVKKSLLPDEAHLAFIKSFKEGKHDYSHADLTGEGITIYTKKQD